MIKNREVRFNLSDRRDPSVDSTATFYELLRARAEQYPDRQWLDLISVDRVSYGYVSDATEDARRCLTGAGVRPGDRVGLMLENGIGFIASFFATLGIGGVAVPLNPLARGVILEHYLRITEPTVVLVEESCRERVAGALAAVGAQSLVLGLGNMAGTAEAAHAGPSLAQFRSKGVAAADWVSRPPDPAAIIFTSGTTGPSKGVVFSHSYLRRFAEQGVETFGYVESDIIYTCLPMFHANALVLVTCASLLVGCQIAASRRFSVTHFWEEVIGSKATVTSLLGSMASLLIQRPPSAEETAHCVTRSMLVPAPRSYYEILENRFGITPLDIYGLTDVGIAISARWGHPVKPGSCGQVLDGFDALLVDEDLQPVPDGEVGRLLVRPRQPAHMSDGYWGMPEATLRSWRGLWFHTGDLLRRDSDGWYYFADREKDAIRRRGENISSYEIEQAFLEHPAVAEVAAYPISSALTEDDVAVALVRKPGHEETERELIEFVAVRLPYFCVPRFVTFVDELPKTPTQKVQKQALRAQGRTANTWDMEESGFRPAR